MNTPAKNQRFLPGDPEWILRRNCLRPGSVGARKRPLKSLSACGKVPLYDARRGIVAARRNALFAGVISAGAVEEASRVLSAVRGRVRRGVVLRRVFDDL